MLSNDQVFFSPPYGTPLQYSCLENPMDRGAWRATVHGVARVGHDLATKPPPAGALLQRRSLNPGIEPRSPTLQADSLPAEPSGKPKNTRVDSLYLLQWVFPTQESNEGFPHCMWSFYQLSYQGSPMLYIFYHKNLAILLSKLSSIHPFSASYF